MGRHQFAHQKILPRAGWVEHCPVQIWERTGSVIQTSMIRLGRMLDKAYLGLAEGTVVRVQVSQPMWISPQSEQRAACAGPIAEVTSDPPARRGATTP